MTAAINDSASEQPPDSCLPESSSTSSAVSLPASLSASQNAPSPATSSPAGSLRKQAGDQLGTLPEDSQVLGFDLPRASDPVPPGSAGEATTAPTSPQANSQPWHKSSARRSVRIAEPEESSASVAAVTDSGVIGAGAARGARRSMRRRSTGEADVEAMLMARGADQLLSAFPSDHRPSCLELPEVDTLLPHQTYPSQDPATSPTTNQQPLSPFERLLQARSGLTTLRQRRSSSQPQQPNMLHHGDPQDADEMARRQAIIANLLQPRGPMTLSRSSLTVERRASNIMSPESKYANVSSQSESASASGKLIPGSKASESQRGKVSAPNSPSGHARALEQNSTDMMEPGFKAETGGPGGSPLGMKASNSRSSKKSQGPTSSRNFAGDAASGRRRSNHIFDVLPDLMPLKDGELANQNNPKALLHQNKELRLGLEMTQLENEKLKAQLEHESKQLRQAQDEIMVLRQAQSKTSGGGGGGLLGCMPMFRRVSVHTDVQPVKM